MYDLLVPTIKGDKLETVYNIHDFPYTNFNDIPSVKGKRGVYYYNISSAFDIETTTIESAKRESKYIKNPYGFMYQWQFCLKDTVVFGRRWEEFIQFLDFLRDKLRLYDKQRLVVYVHNLAYEFQFMKDFIQIDDMFCKDKRKPMKIISDGIEFRCSYFLSNMSLSKFCENSELCIHYKLVDTYDYRKIRTPDTPLTVTEQGYCYNDVRGLCECIDTKLQDDTIVSIPMTNTGYVRREYRKAMANKKCRAIFEKLALNDWEYAMLKRAFRGGNTHANRYLADKILENVGSYDLQSSYPACIMMDNYPMDKFTEVTLDTQQKLDFYCENYCVVMDVYIYNLTAKFDVVIPYIDIAHCTERSNIINDNGRVLCADYVKMTITNIDLDIIRETYDYEGLSITRAIYAERGQLPDELRETMLKFYYAKTLLKGISGKEYEYMKSKNRLNATFGMMVTAIDHSEIKYDTTTNEWEEIPAVLNESLETFYGSRNNFLSYQWGVFVTANARRRLQNMLNIVKTDTVYTDTDSIKFVNLDHRKQFEQLNKKLMNDCETNSIPAYCDRPMPDGTQKRYYLGIWDFEGVYKRFKTLGAKKYCYDESEKDGSTSFHITVSGMSKKLGAKQVGQMENFEIGKTYENIGRTTSYYNEEKPHEIEIEGSKFSTASNIGIVDTTYTLGVTNEYWELIKFNNL